MCDLVSIIIPLYNKNRTIAKSINSILAQTYSTYEIIVVDDGSNDGSREIVLSFKDNRIKYIFKENGGVSSARNLGIIKSQGDWILFLDADDYLYPDCLETLLSPTKGQPKIQISCGSFDVILNPKKKITYANYIQGIAINNFRSLFYQQLNLRAGNFIIRRALASKYPYNEEINRFEDFEIIQKYLRNTIVHCSKISVMSYQKAYSVLSKYSPKYQKDYTFNMNFDNKSFWEKCNLGKMIYLGWAGYKKDRFQLIKIYKFNIIWGIVAKILMLLTKLKNL